MRPFLIGIAGPSCSGKTEIARALGRTLPAETITVSLDSYYLPLDHLALAERTRANFDHPDSLDWPLIIQHVAQLARGETIEEPVYLFDEYTRAAQSRRVRPARFVIVEGLLALHHEQVRERLTVKLFVSTPDELCFARRKQRDVAERGRTLESVERQYRATVRPMAAEFVLPTRRWADLVVSGEQHLERSLEQVHEHLGSLTKSVDACFRASV